jgi:hypothetical protein
VGGFRIGIFRYPGSLETNTMMMVNDILGSSLYYIWVPNSNMSSPAFCISRRNAVIVAGLMFYKASRNKMLYPT